MQSCYCGYNNFFRDSIVNLCKGMNGTTGEEKREPVVRGCKGYAINPEVICLRLCTSKDEEEEEERLLCITNVT